jgi:hypothetical protein
LRKRSASPRFVDSNPLALTEFYCRGEDVVLVRAFVGSRYGRDTVAEADDVRGSG